MTRPTSVHFLALAVMAAAAAGVLLAGSAALVAIFGPGGIFTPRVLAGAAIAGMILTSSALWLMRDAVDEHFRDIARLRALVVSLRAGDTVGSNFPPAGDAESGQLREALLSLAAEIANRRAAPERRLAAALGAVSEAVVVITAQGQVSLVNGAARALLGSEQVEVGTSVFAALAREPVEEAIGAARSGGIVLAALDTVGGRTLAARVSLLGDGEGVVIAIPGAHGEIEADIAHDLSLHDFPPDAPAPTDATALFDLPAAVVDLETTGLDPKLERIVAIGAVRMHGATVFRAATIDCLVDPGVPIPRVATTIHGIADATVAGMPAFAARFPELTALVGEGVVIGHNVGFDLAMLAAEAARAGLPWQVPVALDTCRIAAALDPHESALDLEDVAARHGINVLGRHTALGDALVTAELWRRLSARLIGRGITTLGEARAFAATAKRVIARQRAAGW